MIKNKRVMVVLPAYNAASTLERTVAEREGGIASLRSNSAFDGMRSEARFRQLMKSLRLE